MSSVFSGLLPRAAPADLIVLHHTAGEGDASQVIRTLKQRQSPKAPNGLSVHFIVDQHGKTTQCADVGVVCLHAGARANARSIGVEIANRGRGPCLPKFPRATETHTIHGRPMKLLAFYEEQLQAVKELVDRLCSTEGINRKVAVERRVLTDLELGAYGVVGHLHLTRSKIDPVPSLLDYVAK